MGKTIKIRKAIESDAIKIAAMGACVWVDTYATEGVSDKIARFILSEFTEENILKILRDKTVFVASSNVNLMGYIVLGPESNNTIEIETLYILPKYQRAGIGSKLVQMATKLPVKSIWLSVWELNHTAIDFYSKIGFRETGELYFDLYGDKIRNIVLEMYT